MFDFWSFLLGEMWLSIPGSSSTPIFAGPTHFRVDFTDETPNFSLHSDGFRVEINQDDPDDSYSPLTPN